ARRIERHQDGHQGEHPPLRREEIEHVGGHVECGRDLDTIDTLDAVSLNLPDGTRFGTLRLRRSPDCDTAWASAYFDNPRLYTVWLAAHRPADNAQVRSQWQNNTPPGAYGDMLSLARGCVWVEGWVVTEQGEGPHAKTRCAG
ncbi:DUF2690 domain-containing protein, partial [Microbispora rosea]